MAISSCPRHRLSSYMQTLELVQAVQFGCRWMFRRDGLCIYSLLLRSFLHAFLFSSPRSSVNSKWRDTNRNAITIVAITSAHVIRSISYLPCCVVDLCPIVASASWAECVPFILLVFFVCSRSSNDLIILKEDEPRSILDNSIILSWLIGASWIRCHVSLSRVS